MYLCDQMPKKYSFYAFYIVFDRFCDVWNITYVENARKNINRNQWKHEGGGGGGSAGVYVINKSYPHEKNPGDLEKMVTNFVGTLR